MYGVQDSSAGMCIVIDSLDLLRNELTKNVQGLRTKPGMTVTEKLALVESEARNAEEERKVNENKKRSNSKRTSKQGSRRRKSTLSPEELEELLRVAPDSRGLSG